MSKDTERSAVSETEEEEPKVIDGEVDRMTVDELRKFVDGVASGQIFTDRHIPPGDTDMVGSVFMVVGLGAFAGWTKERIKSVGCVWEWWSEAGPRSINGLPIFYSARIMHVEDWKRAHAAVEKELKRRESIEV